MTQSSIHPRVRLLVGFLALVGTLVPIETQATIAGANLDPLDEGYSVETLLALGLLGEAERRLVQDIEAGDAGARLPYLRLLLQQDRVSEASSRLREWGGELEGAGNLFLSARILEKAEKWEEAATTYEESAAREPQVADHAAFRAGLAWENAERIDEALAAYETAGAAARGRDLSARAYWRAAGLASAQEMPERALENLERIPSRSVIARHDLLDLEVRIYRTQNLQERELRVLREILDRVPSSEEAVAAIQRIEKLEPPTARDRVDFANAALRNRHGTLASEQAHHALDQLRDTPDHELEGSARLALGKSRIMRRQYTRARDELAKLPAGATVADRAEATLDRARCLWRLKQINACLAEYDAIQDGDFPEEHRATAAWEAGREAKDNRRWSEAAMRLAEFCRTFPKHEYADDAAWHGGRAAAEAGDIDAALKLFAHLEVRYPDSPFVAEAGYWSANLLRDRGDEDGACREVSRLLLEHPDSYWTQRARTNYDCPVDRVNAPTQPKDLREWLALRFPDDDPTAGLEAAESITASAPFKRGELLASVGLIAEAENELDGLRRSLERDPAVLLAFAECAWRAGVTRSGMRAITILRARAGLPILSGETPVEVARLLYPLDHLDSVLRWSAEYDLDPLFVYAVMREESWFDSAAVSWVGARGLLQIMPSTGRDLARRVGMRPYDRADLFEPDVNIRLGTFYLSALLNELDREPALALSAYNAGKRNALRWRDLVDGEFDEDQYVVGITYRETYNYVQKVTRSWAIYRHLYGDLVPGLERLHQSAVGAH